MVKVGGCGQTLIRDRRKYLQLFCYLDFSVAKYVIELLTWGYDQDTAATKVGSREIDPVQCLTLFLFFLKEATSSTGASHAFFFLSEPSGRQNIQVLGNLPRGSRSGAITQAGITCRTSASHRWGSCLGHTHDNDNRPGMRPLRPHSD